MARWATRTLTGWGRSSRATSQVARPERVAELAAVFDDAAASSLLARGAGRSYGDAALNGGGALIDMTRLDRVLELDRENARVVAEAGVTFADLIAVLLPHGFMPPVAPGTGFATLGGGIANDVHGKNHHGAGSLGRHVEWLDLRLPGGEVRRVDPAGAPELFRATVGGVGLTGVIERACLRVARVPSNAVRVHKRRVRDLDEHLDALVSEQQRHSHVVGWIDAMARGKALGRGILEAASPSADAVPPRAKPPRRVPFDFPALALNTMTVRLFNQLYYRRVPERGTELVQTYADFLFPLDAIHDWNRIYGKRGFHQFQCVVPFESGAAALRQLLEVISASGQGSFLAVLKAMGDAGTGHLSFPRPGYTLALDFPRAPGVAELIGRLERITCDHGGRTYLAKDSTLSPQLVRHMYPALDAFSAVLREVDPAGRMASDLSRRLALRDGAAA